MIRRFLRQNISDAGSSGSLNDLSFLLIIFFIVIAGFNVNKGFLLNLSSREKPVIVNTQNILKCSLDAEGGLTLEGKRIEMEELAEKIREKQTLWPNMTFLLTIAPQTPYQKFVDVISRVRKLKIENFSFRMEEGR